MALPENLSLIASIMNDRDRAAGRGGVGAVMGSKNLKGIVVRGKFDVPLADEAALVSLVRQTAYLEGFGDILDEGSLRLASRYVYPELAMVSKGMDFAGYDPRDALGMGLNYATLPSAPLTCAEIRHTASFWESPHPVDPHS